MTLRCRYSGMAVLSCKVSDLCDCFDYPEADERAAEIIRERPILPGAPCPTCVHPEGYDRLSGPCPTCHGVGVLPSEGSKP